MYRNIILHWTAGGYSPCITDLQHYHFIIDKTGKIYAGTYNPSDNLNCIDGKYAAHTGGGNTGRIGISICCMKDKETIPTQKQIEAMCSLAASCCIKYGLLPKQCMTHAEFGLSHPKTTSYGKIDINIIPYANVKGISDCGEYLRHKIQWYYNKLKESKD
jgi:hypothetical protein